MGNAVVWLFAGAMLGYLLGRGRRRRERDERELLELELALAESKAVFWLDRALKLALELVRLRGAHRPHTLRERDEKTPKN